MAPCTIRMPSLQIKHPGRGVGITLAASLGLFNCDIPRSKNSSRMIDLSLEVDGTLDPVKFPAEVSFYKEMTMMHLRSDKARKIVHGLWRVGMRSTTVDSLFVLILASSPASKDADAAEDVPRSRVRRKTTTVLPDSGTLLDVPETFRTQKTTTSSYDQQKDVDVEPQKNGKSRTVVDDDDDNDKTNTKSSTKKKRKYSELKKLLPDILDVLVARVPIEDSRIDVEIAHMEQKDRESLKKTLEDLESDLSSLRHISILLGDDDDDDKEDDDDERTCAMTLMSLKLKNKVLPRVEKLSKEMSIDIPADISSLRNSDARDHDMKKMYLALTDFVERVTSALAIELSAIAACKARAKELRVLSRVKALMVKDS